MKSNRKVASRKPSLVAKPYADYPLFPHRTGRWAKKIRGQFRFYGRWGVSVNGELLPVEDVKSSAIEALKEFQRCWPYHAEGREAPDANQPAACTVRERANRFLTHKKQRCEGGELTAHSFSEYYRTCAAIVQHLGAAQSIDALTPSDFERLRQAFAEGCNVVTLGSKINRARVVFKFALDERLIARSVEFGRAFDRPAARLLRAARNEAGPKLFSRDEILKLLAHVYEPN